MHTYILYIYTYIYVYSYAQWYVEMYTSYIYRNINIHYIHTHRYAPMYR